MENYIMSRDLTIGDLRKVGFRYMRVERTTNGLVVYPNGLEKIHNMVVFRDPMEFYEWFLEFMELDPSKEIPDLKPELEALLKQPEEKEKQYR